MNHVLDVAGAIAAGWLLLSALVAAPLCWASHRGKAHDKIRADELARRLVVDIEAYLVQQQTGDKRAS